MILCDICFSLTLLSVIRSIHVAVNDSISFFFMQAVFHCACVCVYVLCVHILCAVLNRSFVSESL